MRIEFVNRPALLYRVARPEGGSLWYDKDGRQTGLVHSVPGALAAHPPMPYDDAFRADGCKWISCTDTMDMLRVWFSTADMIELLDRGYVVQKIAVRNYRRFHFPTYRHEVFCEEQVIGRQLIDPLLVWPDLGMKLAA